jgi:hypothetical protein
VVGRAETELELDVEVVLLLYFLLSLFEDPLILSFLSQDLLEFLLLLLLVFISSFLSRLFIC